MTDLTAALQRLARRMRNDAAGDIERNGPFTARLEYVEPAEGALIVLYDRRGNARGFMNPDDYRKLEAEHGDMAATFAIARGT